MNVIDRGMEYATGTDTCSLTVAEYLGQIVARQLWYTSPAAGTITVYRPKQKTTANAAVAASTALTIDTTALGYVGGAVLTTNDYVLVFDSGGSGGWQLSAISVVGTVSSSTVALTLGTAITCAASDTIYVVRAADIVTLVTANETTTQEYAFNSYRKYPVHAVLAATGTCRISVSYDVEQ